MSQFAWLIPLFPFLAFGLIILFTRPNHRLSAYVAVGGILLAALVAYGVFFEALSKGSILGSDFIHFAPLTWFGYGNAALSMGWMIDPLAAVMVFMVTTVCLMIFIYSVGYMREKVGEEHGHPIIQDDPRYPIFFAYISLFAAAMLTLVISSNLLEFFIAWELMGFCSYALIGFWDVRLPTEHHIDEAQVLRARAASIKAFLTTRVGDVLFMTGMVFLFIILGDLDFKTIFTSDKLHLLLTGQAPLPGMTWLTFVSLLILAGTIGKSAQFPLHIWLPDAMEGPTPVSALIHAATMVAAGVYLIARSYPLFSFAAQQGGPAMQAVAVVGAFTALFAATLGLAQRRHQTSPGLLHDLTIGLYGSRARNWRFRGRLVPPYHARLLQGAAVSRRRFGYTWTRHERHDEDGRVEQEDADYGLDVHRRRLGAYGHLSLRRILEQG